MQVSGTAEDMKTHENHKRKKTNLIFLFFFCSNNDEKVEKTRN